MAVKITEDNDEAERPPLTESLADEAVSARDLFLRKTKRVDTHKISLGGRDIEIKVQALDSKEFNRLTADHTPRRGNERDRNAGFNQDTFPPAFLSRAIVEPKLSEQEWVDIFSSPDWSLGELSALVDLAWSAAQRGFDVPFGANASA